MKQNDWKNYTPMLIGERESHHAAVLIPLIRQSAIENTSDLTEVGEITDSEKVSFEHPKKADYKDESLQILFEVRSSMVKSQPGDICFPGGAREGDETPEQNAVRETCEELLVDPSQIGILGPSDRLFTHHMMVSPVVGYLSGYAGGFNPSEVSETFTVPLSFFLENEPESYTVNYRMEFPDEFPFDRIYGGRDYGWHPRKEEILFWQYEDRVIWGMTAKILYSFIQIWKTLK